METKNFLMLFPLPDWRILWPENFTARLEDFRILKTSNVEDFIALKSSKLEAFMSLNPCGQIGGF